MKINSINELEKFAYKLKENLKPSDVVNLIGDLGAGKTTLVQKNRKIYECEIRYSKSYICTCKYI